MSDSDHLIEHPHSSLLGRGPATFPHAHAHRHDDGEHVHFHEHGELDAPRHPNYVVTALPRDPDPPASEHIGCQFNHEHRYPECYDDAIPTPPASEAVDAAWEALRFLEDRYGHTVESDGEDNWMRFSLIEAAIRAEGLGADPGLRDIAGHSCSQCRRVGSRNARPRTEAELDEARAGG